MSEENSKFITHNGIQANHNIIKEILRRLDVEDSNFFFVSKVEIA